MVLFGKVLLEKQEILFLNDYRYEPFNSVFRVITLLGEPYMWVLAGVFYLVRSRSMAVPVIAAGLLIMPVSYIVKDKAGTDRPYTHIQNIGKTDQVVVVPGGVLRAAQAQPDCSVQPYRPREWWRSGRLN